MIMIFTVSQITKKFFGPIEFDASFVWVSCQKHCTVKHNNRCATCQAVVF